MEIAKQFIDTYCVIRLFKETQDYTIIYNHKKHNECLEFIKDKDKDDLMILHVDELHNLEN